MDVFGGAPRFLAYPRPVVVQSGTDAVLKCQIGGDPRPAVIWERNNEKIHPGGRYRVFEDGNVYNLIITLVTAEDSGQYICKAKNSIGETYAAATLKVEGEAQEMEQREENKPRFLIKPLSTRVGRGEDAVFSCKLWGNPRPEVAWEKDGKKLNEIFESTHFSVGYQDGGWFQLKIFKTRAPDGGVYTCKARNEFGESLAGAVLLVDAGPGHEDEGNRNGYTNGHWKGHQGKPRSGRPIAARLKDEPLPNSAKVKMFAVTEGKHAKFRCYVTGKPKPEIIWRKDGRLILSGRRYLLYEDREGYFTLKVLYCKQQDNGVYVCAASNTAGQTLSAVHLSVKEPPVRFKQPLTDLQVWERDLAILECEVPEDSVPITWYLEDRRLQPGAKYGMEEWGTKRRLTIRDIGVDDDGIYLCEMPDGGRSIAEVAVKGTIVRKLPRKVDVLEGENAAFCVEVEEEEMDIHWYKDGVELRETHQTILKSFGRTHILVFVNTTPQDSGMVTFYVGRSKTSSQLRVKAARHCPPSCPIGVQINTERANAALLSWVPAQDSRKNPPSGYILERQEMGSQEWLQCLTTDSATSVEILGDSVPCEADYRFRICSVNKYGRSGYVEFPRAVHLVPVAKIQAPLQDALVPEGQDACFSIELSASVIGTWFLNGNQLQEDERFSIRRSRTHQSLRIRGVRDTDNGAEITFIAYGIRDSAALYIQAPLVKFTPLSEMDRNKFVEVGNPIVLYCELSDPEASVRWYKNGVELHSIEGLHIQSEGTMRRIVIQSAEFSHSGVYSCDAIDDVIRFNVEVEAPPVRFTVLPEAERNKSIEAGCPIVLQCELSDPSAQVSWYKDGAKLLPQSGLDIQCDSTQRTLVIQKAEFFHSGVYSCKTKGAAVQFIVEVKAPPVRFSAVPGIERRKCAEAGCTVVLQCEISDSTAQVHWFKEGKQILVESGVIIQSEGCMRRIIIQTAALSHSGVYRCATKDDAVEFHVEIRAVPVRFSAVLENEKKKCIEAGSRFELRCEVSDPTAHVRWYKNETELLSETGWGTEAEGTLRMLVVQSADPSHSGIYRCNTSDDSVQFSVDIKAPPVMFSAFPEAVKNQLFEADYPTDLHCEISDPPAKVCWYEDGVELISKSQPQIKRKDSRRTLAAAKTAQASESGHYDCVRKDDVIQFNVQDEASPLEPLEAQDVEKNTDIEESIPIAVQYEILDSIKCGYQEMVQNDDEMLHQDGFESEPQIKSEESIRPLIIKSSETPYTGEERPWTSDDPIQFNVDKAELSHSEVYKGEIYDDSVQCTVDIKADSLRFTTAPEVAKSEITEERCPDQVEPMISDSSAQVCGYEEEWQQPQKPINAKAECLYEEDRSPFGVQEIRTDDVLAFKVDREAPKMNFSTTQEVPDNVPPEAECLRVPNEISEKKPPEVDCLSVLKDIVEQKHHEEDCYSVLNEISEKKTPEADYSRELDEISELKLSDVDSLMAQSGISELKLSNLDSFTVQSEISELKLFDSDSLTVQSESSELKFSDPDSLTVQSEISELKCSDPDYLRVQSEISELIPSDENSLTVQSEISELKLSHPDYLRLQSEILELKPSDEDSLTVQCEISELTHSDPDYLSVQNEISEQKLSETDSLTVQCEISDQRSHEADYLRVLNEPLQWKHPEADNLEALNEISVLPPEADMLGVWNKISEQKPPEADSFGICHKISEQKTAQTYCPKELNETSKQNSPETVCLSLLNETSERKAQIGGHDEMSIIHQQDWTNIKSNLTSEKQFAQLSNIPHKEVYRAETKDQSRTYQHKVKAPAFKPVKFAPLPETARHKTTECGMPLVLQCEIADPEAPVSWYKDGIQLQNKNGIVIQSEDCIRRVVIPTAELWHSGVYNCEAMDDVIKFKVYVKAAPLKSPTIPEAAPLKSPTIPEAAQLKSPTIPEAAQLKSPISEAAPLESPIPEAAPLKSPISEAAPRKSPISEAAPLKSPIPETVLLKSTTIPEAAPLKSPTITEDVLLKSPTVPETGKNEIMADEGDSVTFPQRENLNSKAQVCWYSEEENWQKYPTVSQSRDTLSTFEGTLRSHWAELPDSGVYSCETEDTDHQFAVDPPVKLSAVTEAQRNKCAAVGDPFELQCEVSDAAAQVCWYKDGDEVLSQAGVVILSEGTKRKLSVNSAKLSHGGTYSCKTDSDAITFNVEIKVPSQRFRPLSEMERSICIEVGSPIVLKCEISDSADRVSWWKDGKELSPKNDLNIQRDGNLRKLTIQSAKLSDSGHYTCGTPDDAVSFRVDVQVPPTRFSELPEVAKNKFIEAGCPIILQCEISDPAAQVSWLKDRVPLLQQTGLDIQSEGTMRTMIIHSAELEHTGVYSCEARNDHIAFKVDVAAPPVTFVYIPEEELHRNIVEQDSLSLCCEVSRCDAATQWYKDGVEIQSSDRVLIETENTIRKLIIQSVQLSDAGVYTCRAGDSALIFKVNVREPPVMIVYPKEDVHLDRHVPEEIVLSCELSRPNGKVTWLKDGQKLQESENIKLKTEGPYRRLKILHGRVEDSGEYVCDTADDSKFFHLSIKEPPVRIVSPSQSQMELCQQTSERMVLSCEISRPNASVRWYRDGLEVEENNNLILEVDGVYRRLIIPETTVNDSAEYVCDTADDSVTFFVNIAEPPVRFIRPRKMAYEVEKYVGDTVLLDCDVSRTNAEVSWKKNGEEIEENSNITITEDGSSRQLTIHSAELKDAGKYVCDAKDDVMDFHVKLLEAPLTFLRKADIATDRHILVSDAIVLKCELSRTNGVVHWYKDNESIAGNEHFICEEEGAFRSLIVLNAEIKDSGEYVCDAKDDKVAFSVTVKEAPVSILGNSGNPEHYTLVAGDELILECEVSRENANVQWLCNGRVLNADSRTHIESRGRMRKLVLSNLCVKDSGEYVCDATDDKMTTIVKVQEIPFQFIKKEERANIAAYEEDSVTLCAVVNRNNARVQWRKDGDRIRGDRFCTTSDGHNHYLTINPLKRSDAGEYMCDVGTDQTNFTVHVKDMKVKFSKPLDDTVGIKNSDVVLKCELYKSKGDVQWLKNNKEITPSRHFTIRADGRERSLTIHNVTDDDEGEYACESKDERTSATVVVKSPRIVEFIAELHNVTVMEGEDATFKCVVSPEDAMLVWCMNGWPITSSERFNISSNGLCHMLHINNCQVSDSCKLTAEAEGVISKAILQVQEAQVMFTKQMESVVVEEYGEATLEVEVSLECGEVQWMRQGVVIHPGPKFTLKQSGQKRSLTIRKLALSDRGTYSCETLHDRTQAKLGVEPRKVKIRKGLSELQTFERETASFEVELSHSNVEGAWQKDGSRLKSNNHYRMTAKGRIHSLTISNLSLEDSGAYTFSAENARSSARLTVKETPVSILKKLEDSRYPEGTGVTLECELSRHNVDVKWTKNGVELKPGKNHRIYSMGRKRFLQILKCELGDSGVYVCDAGDATTSCSLEVYERELEVLQSLEDLDIQEDQNAVFMCEVSLDDVPGEWFKNGEKIKPTSTIKIRQEGTKHFLLMCNVKGDDSGEIKFVAKNIESIAYLDVEELPVNIVNPLQDKTALEKTRVILDCTVSNPRCSIRWYKGSNVILPSERFEICSEGCYRKLVIQQVALEDEGTYSVQVGDYTCSAKLTVEAQSILMVQDLQDVEVTAPEEACFACEVSVPVKTPVWTLNGEVLQPGPRVLVEKMGTVHRLTLRQTSEDMSGVVEFVSGKAKSTAQLRVKK
ncbi:obscurin isoform X1 [Astyanax mexicanus]|uniref:obscurin isoform X1 n=1 Tax=Astyanax mexicanus TaxID=7994 RepID=UPI0020CAAB63|nr:obscurin isoform X1 [Astyanax mexicanus]XP_049340508.1 obscurin isoform X1 [Astyanax mexicanus]